MGAYVPFPFPYCHPTARILDQFEEPEFEEREPFMYSGPHQLPPEGPRPPVATSPQTHGPLIPGREALLTYIIIYC